MTPRTDFYTLLADGILLIHFAFVAFVVLGLVVIWAGYFCRWEFVRDFRFRLAHLVAMGFVLAESLAGIVCPLTTWENKLRIHAGGQAPYPGSFIQHWISRLMFYDWSDRTFTLIYGAFFVFIALTFWIVRPRPPTRT